MTATQDDRLTALAALLPEYETTTPADMAAAAAAIGYLWRVLRHGLGEPALTDPTQARIILGPLAMAEHAAAEAFERAANVFRLYAERGGVKLQYSGTTDADTPALVAGAATLAADLAERAAVSSRDAHQSMADALGQITALSLRPTP